MQKIPENWQKTPGTNWQLVAKKQDTRLIYISRLLSYIPEMNNWNLKLKHNIICNSTQRRKYLCINPAKYSQELYAKTEKVSSKCKCNQCSWIGKFNTFKMLIPSNLICRFYNPIQNPSRLLCEYQQTDSKMCMQNRQHNIEKQKSWRNDATGL